VTEPNHGFSSTIWAMRLAAGLLWLSLASCTYKPAPAPNCVIDCTEGLCPSGMSCVDDYCVQPGFDDQCSTGSLKIVSEPQALLYACRRLEFLLEAEGGSPRKTWSLLEGPNVVEVEDVSDTAMLTAEPDTLSEGKTSMKVAVTDSHAASASREVTLSVVPCLEIETATFPSACAGHDVNYSLEARGGTGDTFLWSAANLPQGLELQRGVIVGRAEKVGTSQVTLTVSDGAESTSQVVPLEIVGPCPELVPEQTFSGCVGAQLTGSVDVAQNGTATFKVLDPLPDGITFDGATGTFEGTPKKAGTYELSVEVTDDIGTSNGVVTLKIATSGSCSLSLETRALTDACAGQPYAFQLTASGGQGDYAFEGVELPDWLKLSATGRLSSNQPAPRGVATHAFAVRVRSGEPAKEFEMELRVRSNCKFAYVTRPEADRRLFLGDVRVPAPDGEQILAVSDALTDGTGVEEFEFSRDGESIAFTAGGAGGPDQLFVRRFAGARSEAAAAEVVLPDADQVLVLAASDRDSLLGVLFTDAAADIHVAVVDLDADPPIATSERSVRGYIADLFWFNGSLCHYASSPSEDSSLDGVIACYAYEDSTLDAANLLFSKFFASETFASDTYVRIADTKLHFAARIGQRYRGITYYGETSSSQLEIYGIPDPTLNWILQTTAPLEDAPGYDIYPMRSGVNSSARPEEYRTALPHCTRVHAWEAAGKAVACSSSDSELYIAQVNQDKTWTVRDSLEVNVPNNDSHKAFLPGANWFVYEGDDRSLVAVDLREPTTLAQPIAATLGRESFNYAFAALAHSDRLIEHAATQLAVADLAEERYLVVSGSQALSEPAIYCEDELRSEGPRAWCGSERPARSFVASPDGNSVVFSNQQGRPFLVDVETAFSEDSAYTPSPLGTDPLDCPPGTYCYLPVVFAP
jgi:Putative Ig domain